MALVVCCFLIPGAAENAQAGGFDVPDIGAEALGRGGAFAAKADSPLALYYNVAGLAQQRGNRAQVDVNLIFYDQSFTRAGTYPGDPKDPRTPWAGKPYPTVHDEDNFGYQPFLGFTTNFGIPNFTLGFGIYAPPGIGKHQYGKRRNIAVPDAKDPNKTHISPRYEVDLSDEGGTSSWSGSTAPNRAPAPTRYDIAQTDLLIIMPTLAASYRINKYLDVGAAAIVAYGRFDLMNANMTNLGPYSCAGSPDYPGCDSYGRVYAAGTSFSGQVAVLAHPTSWLDIGASYRPQITFNAKGSIHPYVTPESPLQLDDFPVTFSTKLPHLVRFGIRAVSHYADGTERADIEFDGTWEKWSAEQYAYIHSDDFPNGKPNDPNDPSKGSYLDIQVPHHYRDTFSARLGGAYNYRLTNLSRLIFRGGAYFDSAATHYADTHLDALTAAKYAFTLGLGYKYRGFTINLAYAAIFSPDRNVTNSNLTAISSTDGTEYVKGVDPVITVGNGLYQTSIQTLSLGLTFNFSEFGSPHLFAH